MPVYCFVKPKTGEILELNMSFEELRSRQREDGMYELDDGTLLKRDFFAEQVSARPAQNWPMESDALAVHPAQVKEAEQASIDAGIPTHFNKQTGAPIFNSPSHRKAYCKAYGFYDRNGGFSDPTPS